MHEQLPSQERGRRELPPPELPSRAIERLPEAAIQPLDSREELAGLSRERAELMEELSILNGAIRLRRPNLQALSPENPMSLKQGPKTALSHREYEDIWEAKETIEARLKANEERASELERVIHTPEEIVELRQLEARLTPEEVPEELSRFATKEAGPKEHPFVNVASALYEKTASTASFRWYGNFMKIVPRFAIRAYDALEAVINKISASLKEQSSAKRLENERKQLPVARPEQESAKEESADNL